MTSRVKAVWMRVAGLALLISAACGTGSAAEAQVSPKLLEGMQWRSVGPGSSVRVR